MAARHKWTDSEKQEFFEGMVRDVPQDRAAEESVIACLLFDRDLILRVSSTLSRQDFHDSALGEIYEAVLSLFKRKEPPDTLTVSSELKRVGAFERVGGYAKIAELGTRTVTLVHVEHYARLVKRASTLRKLISAGGAIAAEGYGDYEFEADAVANAEKILAAVYSARAEGGFVHISAAVSEWRDRFEARLASKVGLSGLPSGYRPLDEITCGWNEGDLVVFGARPGNGKSAILLDQALYLALQGHHVGFQSLEMSRASLIDRMVANHANIDGYALKNGASLTDDELSRVANSEGVISELPIYIDEVSGLNISEIRAGAHRLKALHGIDILMVDYLQKVVNPRKDGRVQEVAEVARRLKDLARELKIPVLAAAQLTRGSEERNRHTPTLADFADSSEIEKEADVAILMHREELYQRTAENRNHVTLKVAKQRNGPAGMTFDLYFASERSHFYEIDYTHTAPTTPTTSRRVVTRFDHNTNTAGGDEFGPGGWGGGINE